jgi:hypothetical protein
LKKKIKQLKYWFGATLDPPKCAHQSEEVGEMSEKHLFLHMHGNMLYIQQRDLPDYLTPFYVPWFGVLTL